MDEQNKPKSKSIETYAGDMAETIEQSGGSLIKKIIHEQEAAEEEKKKYSPESAKNRAFTYASIALLGVGLAAVALIVIFQKDAERVEIPPQFIPLVFTDKTDFIDITDTKKAEIAAKVRAKAVSLAMPGGKVAGLYFTNNQKTLGFQSFLESIESNFPTGGFDLVEENFFTGVRGSDGSNEQSGGDLFFVLKAESFVGIFPVLREWETKMFNDLGLFFQDGASPLYTALLTADFEDGFVLNKNARFLTDEAGSLALLYVFVDDNTVVIADSFDAAEEAILRLSAGDVRK